MTRALAFWLLLAVLLFWWLGAHNRLVRLRARAISCFASVEQRMLQTLALLSEEAAAVATGDAAPSGLGSRAGLQAAAVQFEVALRVAAKQPLDAGAVAALQSAYATVRAVWERHQAEPARVLDAPAPAQEPRAWRDNTLVVGEAVALYNAAVTDYNGAIRQFPASLLARFLRFAPAAAL